MLLSMLACSLEFFRKSLTRSVFRWALTRTLRIAVHLFNRSSAPDSRFRRGLRFAGLGCLPYCASSRNLQQMICWQAPDNNCLRSLQMALPTLWVAWAAKEHIAVPKFWCLFGQPLNVLPQLVV